MKKIYLKKIQLNENFGSCKGCFFDNKSNCLLPEYKKYMCRFGSILQEVDESEADFIIEAL